MRDVANSKSPLGKKRKEFANLFFAGLASVLRDFKSLGVLNARRLRAIALLQSVSPLRLQFSRSQRSRRQPLLPLGRVFWHLLELPLGPWQPLVELRNMRVQHIDLFLEHIVNRHDNVRAKWLRP